MGCRLPMRAVLLVALACLLAAPLATADHDGETPIDCSGPSPCIDYCIHGTGAGYSVGPRDLDPTHEGCWQS